MSENKILLTFGEMRDPKFITSKIHNPGPKRRVKPQFAGIAGSENPLRFSLSIRNPLAYPPLSVRVLDKKNEARFELGTCVTSLALRHRIYQEQILTVSNLQISHGTCHIRGLVEHSLQLFL